MFRFWWSVLRRWLRRPAWFWNLRHSPKRPARIVFWSVWVVLVTGLSTGVFAAAFIGGMVWHEAEPLVKMKMGESWSNRNLQRTRKGGDAIVAAIHTFHKREGHLPATLDDLVPRDLDAIKQPTVGDCQWHYERAANPKYFTLIVYSKYVDTMGASLWYSYPLWYSYNEKLGWRLRLERF